MKIYFLDFEASSIDQGSYPIEIGWVDETGKGESYLIQPHSSWQGWSKASESIHHITQDMLKDATAASEVATRALEVLAGAILISDNPAFEAYWLGMLLETIDAKPMHVNDIIALLGEEVQRLAPQKGTHLTTPTWQDTKAKVLTVYDKAIKGLHKHRALADAESLWKGWSAVRKLK